MTEDEEISRLQREILDQVIPFEKLPDGAKASAFEYLSFRKELTKESDRGCALLSAAHLDYMLEVLLKKKLVGGNKHKELIFGFNGPLGTFSSRILLCFSIGLISSDFLHDIQIIRKIRNEFGHKPSIIGFEDQNIKAQCEKLKHNVLGQKVKARLVFINVVSALSGQIEASIIKCEPFEELPELDLENRKKGFDKTMTLIRELLNPELRQNPNQPPDTNV